MSTHTNSRPVDRTDADPATNERTEIAEIRQKLARNCEEIREDAPELYEQIQDWIQESLSIPDGNVGSAVNSRLRELKRGNKMRDHRGVEDPEAAFSDDCEGCPHYGVACPMVKRHSVTKTRDRYIRTAETDDVLVNDLTDLAIEWDCHIVLDVLEDYQDQHQDYIADGYNLHSQMWSVLRGEPTGEDRLEDVERAVDESPPPEVEADVQATVDAVMGDDENEGDGS